MQRLLGIFSLLMLVLAGLTAWRGLAELALWPGLGGLVLLLLVGGHHAKVARPRMPRPPRRKRRGAV